MTIGDYELADEIGHGVPDTNGMVEVESPPGYEGYVVMARRVDGDIFYQMHVVRKAKHRVSELISATVATYAPA